MSRSVILHPLAEQELRDAMDFHEGIRAGLGAMFLQSVEAVIERARQWPMSGPPLPSDGAAFTGERRLPVRRFRFVVEYAADDETLWVTAIHHQSRRPGYRERRTF